MTGRTVAEWSGPPGCNGWPPPYVRECQDAIQIGLVQIRKRLIDAANELLDNGGVPAVRAASRVIVENFPPVARVADVSDGEQIEDLSDIPDADIARMKEIRDAARAKAQAKVSDGRDAARGKGERRFQPGQCAIQPGLKTSGRSTHLQNR